MAGPLDLVQLRTLVAIADCGGFGRAATALHLSQPTVSQHVRSLEKRIGAAVVEKDGRRARLTPSGERLLVEARRILAVHDDALDRLEAHDDRPLVIGSTETTAHQVLPELLGTIRDAFPGRRVHFRIDRSTRMEEGVARGEIDAAVLLGIGESLAGAELGVLPLRWWARSAQPPAGPVPLVAYNEPCGMRRRALERLTDAGRVADVVAESPTLEGVLAAARAGLGIAVLPSGEDAPAGLVRVRGLPDLGTASVRLIGRRGVDPTVEATVTRVATAFFAASARGEPKAERTIAVADRFPSRIALGRATNASVAWSA
jgi:DNA-binding transcriptional LysR family regulator